MNLTVTEFIYSPNKNRVRKELDDKRQSSFNYRAVFINNFKDFVRLPSDIYIVVNMVYLRKD